MIAHSAAYMDHFTADFPQLWHHVHNFWVLHVNNDSHKQLSSGPWHPVTSLPIICLSLKWDSTNATRLGISRRQTNVSITEWSALMHRAVLMPLHYWTKPIKLRKAGANNYNLSSTIVNQSCVLSLLSQLPKTPCVSLIWLEVKTEAILSQWHQTELWGKNDGENVPLPTLCKTQKTYLYIQFTAVFS